MYWCDIVYKGNLDSMKHCINCNKNKELKEFYIQRLSSDGRRKICRNCSVKLKKESKEKRLQERKEKIEINIKLSEIDKKEKQKRKNQKQLNVDGLQLCYQCGITKELEKFVKKPTKQYLSGRSSTCKKCHSLNQSNYMKERKKTDIIFKLKCNLRTRINNAMNQYIKKGIFKIKHGSAVKDLGCSLEEFKIHLESLFKFGMNWNNYGNKEGQWSLDHILPLSKIDLTNKDEFLRANHYTNLQPLWHFDNIKKGNSVNTP